ncbi:MAG: HAMP domain-containing sensor histidine kinase [Ruminococcus sp.]|nr:MULTISPECIES: HAMP domain-containing sensor histidine kinase [Ruminococcus]MCI5599483.1 HAMP domain-containing histidine kinase [Ruminococcus sp.]MDD5889113.1 HAMP domain-containing sensor histidine kinase [Ruminococcus sp.]MDD6532031.1 HAMP domain-containing sensor histidine kinase [Ruminococcus sp.]MDD6708683.1 HAMP domain-containing sensor histidine kinase [Ruminococcus sp.]MDY3661615.1 HAMP domain-containing sensor histidine kinase [Ruminococcus bovis]
MTSGITKRWLLNILSVVALIIVVIVLCLSFMIRAYYYNSVEQSISVRCNELTKVFDEVDSDTTTDFLTTAQQYIEDFPDKNQLELQSLNSVGRVTLTSTGFLPDEKEEMPDFDEALKSPNGYAVCRSTLTSGEKVFAGTKIITSQDGTVLGAIRYVTSLSDINFTIIAYIVIFSLIGAIIIFAVLISGRFFVRSIVGPIKEMSQTARNIASGDFETTKITSKYDDEIGDLAESINYMAHELKQTEQLKNDFISRVSHELRTPLTAIKGWSETMLLTGTDIDQGTFKKGMTIILKESGRLTSIVEELLDISRIQSGRMKLMTEKIDLVAELDEAVYMLKERSIQERKHLMFDSPIEPFPPVMGDKNRLRQVFLNIIDNALKYTPEGGNVIVQILNKETNIEVLISDTGCGIAPEDLPKVKDKFYKANQNVGGSGIGLAVADEIVQMHGGTLDIESGIGVGTTVKISIPVYDESQSKDDKGEN